MNNKLKFCESLILTTIVLILSFTPLFSQNDISNSKIEKIDSLLSFFPATEPGGVVLIAKEGKTVYQKAFGKSNLELDVDMNINNLMGIASLTKPFTAMAILNLAEEGKLSVKDNINQYISHFPLNGDGITIEHLLSHTSGLPWFDDSKDLIAIIRGENADEGIVEFYKSKKFEFLPGAKYKYSNSAYILLGYILEKVTGKTYENYLNKTFFTSLNIENTTVEDFSKVIPKRASGYDSFNGAPYQIKEMDCNNNHSVYSAGGLMSTVTDLSIWYNAIFDGKVVNGESLQKAFSLFKLNDGTDINRGLAWFVGNLNGSKFIYHDGLDWGYGGILLYFPKEKLFIAQLKNCGYCQWGMDVFYQAAPRIASVILDCEYYNNDTIHTKRIDSFEAVYTANPSQTRTIIVEGNHIYLRQENGAYLPIYQLNNDTFFVERTQETLFFSRNKKGDIEGLTSYISKPILFNRSKIELPLKSLSQSILDEISSGKITADNLFFEAKEKNRNGKYYSNEQEINNLGYLFLGKKELDITLEIFKLNVFLFPKSANSFDSLAEAFLNKNDYQKALFNYQKSLELDPLNQNAQSMINKIIDSNLKNKR